jgi:molybdenum cofactor biosynthesis enzyme MoaA
MTESENHTAGSGSSLCLLPWFHLATTIDGVWGRCCYDGTNNYEHLYESVGSEPDFTLKPDAIGCTTQSRYAKSNPDRVFSLDEAFNAPAMRETRLMMLRGERPDACSFCYQNEERGSTSERQWINQKFSKLLPVDELLSSTGADGSLGESPSSLDIRLGNTCNLTCVMCCFPISSRFGTDSRPVWTTANIDPYSRDDEFWASLRRNAGQLRYLYLAGGEPFLQPSHERLLDLLIETGAAPRIEIAYNSNLTVLPAGLFERLRQFARVLIAASCDGTGEIFEKIRVGAKWPTFVQNLRTARQQTEVWIDVAVQADNIANIGSLIDFAAEEQVPIRFENYVHYPEELCIRNLSADEKRRHTASLQRLADEWRLRMRPADNEQQARGLPSVADQLTGLAAFLNS